MAQMSSLMRTVPNTVCRLETIIQRFRPSGANEIGPFGYTPLVFKGPSPLGTVLVCDDEEINRALLVRLLQGYGYQVVPVSSGAEALATWWAQNPKAAREDVVSLLTSFVWSGFERMLSA